MTVTDLKKTSGQLLEKIYYHEDQYYIDILTTKYNQKCSDYKDYFIKKNEYCTLQELCRLEQEKDNNWYARIKYAFVDQTIKFFDPQTGFTIVKNSWDKSLALGKIPCELKGHYSSLYPKKDSQKKVLDIGLNFAKNLCAVSIVKKVGQGAIKKRLKLMSLKNLETLWQKKVKDCGETKSAKNLTFSNDGSKLMYHVGYTSFPIFPLYIHDTETGSLLRTIKQEDIPPLTTMYENLNIGAIFFNEKGTEIVVQSESLFNKKHVIIDVENGTLVKYESGFYKESVNEKKSFDGTWKLMIYNDTIEVYKKNSDTENK